MEKAQMMEDCAANTTLLGTQQNFSPRKLRSTRDACLEGTWRVTSARNHGAEFINLTQILGEKIKAGYT